MMLPEKPQKTECALKETINQPTNSGSCEKRCGKVYRKDSARVPEAGPEKYLDDERGFPPHCCNVVRTPTLNTVYERTAYCKNYEGPGVFSHYACLCMALVTETTI